MARRCMILEKMNFTERDALVTRAEVKAYVDAVRESIKNKRALTNIGLTIPEVMLGLIRENVTYYSKLYRHVNVRPLRGNGRLVVAGTVPEAVWTDCCGTLNELDLTFNDVEVGCWKVGGYFAVCNAIVEDSDIDILAELLESLGQAIGLALDKAILYGTGTRMPLGIVARLAQTEAPADYPATARTWVDLHTSNIKTISSGTTGKDLFAQFVIDSGAAKGKYSRGAKVWVMNETTYTALIAQATAIDAAGAIVSGVNGVMPIVGGVIEVLSFIPDNVIIGGYFDLYLLAERAGNEFYTSEHVRFLQDQTVIKGTGRYDGQPVIAEGFVAIGINSTTPTSSMSFDPNYAGMDLKTLTVTAAAGSAAGKTVLTVSGTVAQSSPDLQYKIGAFDLKPGDSLTGWDDLTSGTTAITAAAGTVITVAELDSNDKVVAAGSVLSVPKTS